MASTHTTASSAARLRWTVLVAASLALLAACGKDDDRTVGQKVDAAVNAAEQKTDAAAETLRKDSAELKERAQNTVDKVADKVTDKVEDAAITTAVNAALAKDATLSVLSINVDTTAGAVVLRGSVSSTTARDRATGLAMAVKGVQRVDNQLLVKG